MKMTYTKSAFEMPDGKYLARFLGCTLREDQPGQPPRLGQDGKPLPPAMTWDFEIAEGPEKGKKCDKLTGRVPTPKSGCGKMLVCVTDTMLKDGAEVDLAAYVGQLYRITVMENRVSDNPGPVRVYDHGTTPGAAPVDARGAPVPHKPPPPPMPAAAPPPQPGSGPDLFAKWDYHHDGVWHLDKETTAVTAFLREKQLAAESLYVKPAGGTQLQMKTADEFGFPSFSPIPY